MIRKREFDVSGQVWIKKCIITTYFNSWYTVHVHVSFLNIMDLGTIKSFGMFQIAWGYILNWLTLMSLAIKINYIYLYVYLSSMDSSFLWSAQQKNQRKFVSTNIDESSLMHKANIEGLRLLVHLGYSGQGVSCKTKINVFNWI